MKDWRFLDALKREAETDLERHPERRPWGKTVSEVVEAHPDKADHTQPDPGRGHHQRAGRRGGRGGQRERSEMSVADYAAAQRDLERQQAADQRRADAEQRSYEQRRAAEDVRVAAREAADRVRRGDPPPGYRR